jgi:hypothetical protein
MQRYIGALILVSLTLQTQAAFAKARTVVVYAVQSSQDAQVVDLAASLAGRIDATPGYAGKFESRAAGTLGRTAARAGADEYILVQATGYADGSEIATVTAFSTSDEPLGASQRIRLDNWKWPHDFAVTSLLDDAGMPATADAHSLVVPGGTQVVVSVLNTVSSNNASADDTFAFQTMQDVVINGYVVIKKGAPGQGTITSVDGAASNGHAGKLALRFDYVMSADGLKIPLTDSERVASGDDKKGASSTATIVGYALLGLPGLFMHNFVRGGQSQVDPSMKITVYVDHNVHVAATEASGAAAGYAQ